ncbi:hypothetical protein [Pseudoalteromonas sp. KAN5]|uniref:hypothetical protein n=2 Tax=Pseudoalteromonas TaxID=53246 RepID=UPI001FCAE09B|nr:hypothetical protein [Pseudoalteromonas sp. KAN5]BDF94462.1 hypothetical protein KAN5_13000 [Pseudoalteromonas sp. KAN5]
MDISKEELSYIVDLYQTDSPAQLNCEHTLTLHSEIPSGIAHLLSQAKLTLLAEVAHYQLWFPLELKVNELGTLTPYLNAPEVIDTQGIKRCWRWDNLEIQNHDFKIESISSTGLFLKPLSKKQLRKTSQQLKFILPNKKKISIEIEPVRVSDQGIAAKITQIHQGREQLRAYLFEAHKRKHASLYEYV